MDDKSLRILEFHRIREIISGFTSFSTSRELTKGLMPVTDYAAISLSLKQSTEAHRLLSLEPEFSIGGVTDIRERAKMAVLGRVLEPVELLEVRCTLEATRKLRSSLTRLSEELSLLWAIAGDITPLPGLEESINRCISPTAELLDSASPALAATRRRLKELRNHLLDRLHSIINSPRGQRMVQEPIVTEREGRYVIPIKIESRKEIKGIVHDISNSGATLFIEPWSTLTMGNEIRELTIQERREIDKILAGLSAKVAEREAEISRNIALVAELDLALAKARYAGKFGASEPVVISPGENPAGDAGLRLVAARHPLLGEGAVPMTLEMGRDFSILVITGPNTGGKTVALKTIGLLSLMMQAGIPIPASEESRLPVFDGIFADIGDEQSIEQTLSTFSWHIGNIIRIINSATENSLVLLDELGISTDPAEGSALARSILLHFLSLGTITVATTHYSDLKAFAHTTDGFKNASLDFDPVTFEPTYHLSVGTPGGSNALATAARLGLPTGIIARAREMTAKGSQELEALLADLMNERQRFSTLCDDLEKQRGKLEEHNAELSGELNRLRAEEQRIIQETRDGIVKQAAELHREIQQATSELRREKKREVIEQGRQALASVQKQLKTDDWQPKASTAAGAETADDSRITPGDTVWLKEVNIAAKVLSLSEETGQVEVQAGQAKLSLSIDRVARIASPAGIGLPVSAPVRIEAGSGKASLELNLRGRRADEVEVALDSFLNDAAMANLTEVRIVHGIGSGTVRSIVREALVAHPLVTNFRCGGQKEGGDGVTIVRL